MKRYAAGVTINSVFLNHSRSFLRPLRRAACDPQLLFAHAALKDARVGTFRLSVF
jgi:hypothetical protein